MPIKPSHTTAKGNSASVQSRANNSSRNDDSGSGGKLPLPLDRLKRRANKPRICTAETPVRRRLVKAASTTFHMNNSLASDPQNSRGGAGPRSGGMGRRRLSIRDQKAPQGPRPQDNQRWR